MTEALHTNDDELRDLPRSNPELIDATTGQRTGLRLQRWLGSGGMATVFLAEWSGKLRSSAVSPRAPNLLAIKFNKLSTDRELGRLNLSSIDIFKKELVALGRVMERNPPSEFVVGLYGSGATDVQPARGGLRRLPWLAMEYVDGGTDGSTLSDRVARAPAGIDPVRALRLVRSMIAGVRALHGLGIVHRDLKPDNVFVSGPIDDETPKIGDCGIARVEGLSVGTIPAMTPAYGGPEQMLSACYPARSNPLVGAWSDVHALAAIIWQVMAGEEWSRGDVDPEWQAGQRRSLRTTERLHDGYMADPQLMGELDGVLRRGAAPRIPAALWQVEGAADYEQVARLRAPAMFEGPERFATLDGFACELLPILVRFADRWTERAVRENRAPTAFRATRMLAVGEVSPGRPLADVREIPSGTIEGTDMSLLASEVSPVRPGGLIFLPDGKALARFGERLVYFIDGRAHKVSVPAELEPMVGASRWLGRAPGGGFALVGEQHVVLIRGGAFTSMELPARVDGGEVGPLQGLVADGRTFAIVTEETDDSEGGPELWTSADGIQWSPPTVLPLNAVVHDVAVGPYGTLVVGRRGKRARALRVGLDGNATVFTKGVNDKPPLTTAVAGALRDSWGAGPGIVLGFGRSGVAAEEVQEDGEPVAMGLDLVGVPWLVYERTVLRRDGTGAEPCWRVYHRRSAELPSFVGVGFTLDGAHVMDERGGGVFVEPHDIDAWRPTKLPRSGS